jgi:multimeric flavodoxin WrbA
MSATISKFFEALLVGCWQNFNADLRNQIPKTDQPTA